MTNPFVSPNEQTASSDPKTSKRIENLLRNSKQLPLLTILGCIIPLLIVVAALAGLAYAYLRFRLLNQLDNKQLGALGPEDLEKVSQIRSYSFRYYVPSIIFGVIVLFFAVVIWAMSQRLI